MISDRVIVHLHPERSGVGLPVIHVDAPGQTPMWVKSIVFHGPASQVTRPQSPLPCGTTSWAETDSTYSYSDPMIDDVHPRATYEQRKKGCGCKEPTPWDV